MIYAVVSTTVTDELPVALVAVTTIVVGVPELPITEVAEGEVVNDDSPEPTSPELFEPQHLAAPETTAHDCSWPAPRDVTPAVRPVT